MAIDCSAPVLVVYVSVESFGHPSFVVVAIQVFRRRDRVGHFSFFEGDYMGVGLADLFRAVCYEFGNDRIYDFVGDYLDVICHYFVDVLCALFYCEIDFGNFVHDSGDVYVLWYGPRVFGRRGYLIWVYGDFLRDLYDFFCASNYYGDVYRGVLYDFVCVFDVRFFYFDLSLYRVFFRDDRVCARVGRTGLVCACPAAIGTCVAFDLSARDRDSVNRWYDGFVTVVCVNYGPIVDLVGIVQGVSRGIYPVYCQWAFWVAYWAFGSEFGE